MQLQLKIIKLIIVVMVFIYITYPNIKTIELFKILAPKVFEANNNEVVNVDGLELILFSRTSLIKS